MRIRTKSNLFYEIMKIKNAVQKKDSDILLSYHEEYLKELKVPSREVFHAGCFSLYSEKISFHVLSIYYLLDLIDFYWDGKKFINLKKENNSILLNVLNSEKEKKFEKKETITDTIYDMQKLTKHRLHIFLVPFEYEKEFLLEITYPGNVLLLFPKEDHSLLPLYQGVEEFYRKKQLKEILPHWADTTEDFKEEFIKWCQNTNSKFSGRKMN